MAPVGQPRVPDVVPATVRDILVLDTNVVLDLLVFEDAATACLMQALDSGAAHWLATSAMRKEFDRVLAYPRIAARLQPPGKTHDDILSLFDRLSRLVAEPPIVAVHCSDPDDQMFIDLSVAHQACLLSKDDAVLRLRKRLADLDVVVQNAWRKS